MEQLKFKSVKEQKEDLNSKKSALADELLSKEEIKKLIEKLNVSMEEFDYYLGYFLSYYEDRCFCKECKNIENCPKEIKGTCLRIVRNGDFIEREYSLCSKKENWTRLLKNYLIRDFNEDLLKIDVSNIEGKKTRKEYEKQIFKMIMSDNKREGMFIYGPSSSGKTYPLIVLCNYLVQKDQTCSFVDVKTFIESLKNTFNSNRDDYIDLMDKVKTCDVLVLDNLGEEKQSEWVRDEVIGSILDYRNKNNLLTFITSCYSIEELEKMFNVSKTNNEGSKIKTTKFIDKIKGACPNIIELTK